METYKTWEAIKMLTENPKLKFTRVRETIGRELKASSKIDQGQIIGWYLIRPSGECMLLDDEWTLVEEPVDFWTAFEAWKNEGKRITSANTGESVEGIFRNDVIFTSREIKGKWYIQEGKDNE